ncbi:hypothetical protein HYW54_01520 [Candidatus Gottesmanbacteria bacterium]|nr:hypothetical protein [Candidatus Gottesmanbacteria bacterium]
MENERVILEAEYRKNEGIAKEAFRGGQDLFPIMADALFKKGNIANILYERTGQVEWDLKAYGAFNAAGGAFEAIGSYPIASQAYKLALLSCRRLAEGRSSGWEKNINHLEKLINQLEEVLNRS